MVTNWHFFCLLLIECFAVYLLFYHPLKLFGTLLILIVSILIISKPVAGLYLSTAIAYSGVASSLLQGLLLPVILLSCVSAIFYLLETRAEGLQKATQNTLFLLFATTMLLSFTYAMDLTMAFESLYQFTKYFILYLLLINIIETRDSLRGLLWVLTITGILMFAYGIYTSFIANSLLQSARMTSFIEDPNSYAIKLVPVVAFSYCISKTEKSNILKMLGYIILLSSIAAIILSFSRGSLLGLLAIFIILGAKELRKPHVVIAFVIILIVAIALVPNELLSSRFTKIGDITMDKSIVQRLKLLKGGVQMFLEHPVFGVGIGNFIVHSRDYTHTINAMVAHNSYLHVAAELGIIGVSFFIAMILTTLKQLRTIYSSISQNNDRFLHFYSFCIFAAFMGFLTNSLFLSEHLNVALFSIVGMTVVLWKLAASPAREIQR